jgi:hypothetical protein
MKNFDSLRMIIFMEGEAKEEDFVNQRTFFVKSSHSHPKDSQTVAVTHRKFSQNFATEIFYETFIISQIAKCSSPERGRHSLFKSSNRVQAGNT